VTIAKVIEIRGVDIRHLRPWCLHYSGMSGKESCDKWVRFDSLPSYGTKGFMSSCPCFSPSMGCEMAEYPTNDQMEEADKKVQDYFGVIDRAKKAITEKCGGKWKRGDAGADGEVDCPACNIKDSLRFSRAGVNGYIHASCKTEGCISWME